MSLTPTQPNFTQTVKSFWNRPEGTAGKLFLCAGGLALTVGLIMFWGMILPFLIGVAGNTIQLAMMIGFLGLITSPIWSSSVRLITRNMFQSSMRWATGMFIEIDPIGILRNNVLDLKKKGEVFDKAVSTLAGSRQRLQSDIDSNKKEIMNNKSLADQTDKVIAQQKKKLDATNNPRDKQTIQIEIERLTLTRGGYYSTAGLLMNTVQNEEPLLAQTDNMYNQLVRLRDLAAFKVDSLTQQADMLDKRRSMILAGRKALGAAQSILGGDAQQLAMIDQTIDYLNNEADDTIGAMNDFNRWSEKYLTDKDIQAGAAADQAEKLFENLNQKLSLPSTNITNVVSIPDFTSGNQSNTKAEFDYAKLLK